MHDLSQFRTIVAGVAPHSPTARRWWAVAWTLPVLLFAATSCSRQDQVPVTNQVHVDAPTSDDSTATRGPSQSESPPVPKQQPLPPVFDIPDQPGDADAIVLFPDGKTVAACGDGGKVQLYELQAPVYVNYELQDQDPIHTFEGLPGRPRLALSDDGKRLAQASASETRIIVWSMETKERLRTLEGHDQPISDLAFSPDVDRLAASGSSSPDAESQGSIKIWNLVDDSAPTTLAAPGIARITFSPDGRSLAAAGRGAEPSRKHSEATLWNLETGEIKTTWQNNRGGMFAVAFSPDGETLAIAERNGARSLQLADRIRLVDVATGDEKGILLGHANEIHGLSFSPDGLFLLSAGRDDLLRVFQVPTHSQRALVDLRGFRGGKLTFSKDGQRFAISVGNGSREIHPTVWDLDHAVRGEKPSRGQPPFAVEILHRRSSRQIQTLAFSSDGTRLASSDNATGTWLYDTKSWNGQDVNGESMFVALDFSADLSSALVLDTALRRREVRAGGAIRDIGELASETISEIVTLPGGGTRTATGPIRLIYGASVSPDDRYVATSHSDFYNGGFTDVGILRVRDWNTLRLVTAIQVPEGRPHLISSSRDGRWLAAGGGASFNTRFMNYSGPVSLYDLSDLADRQKWKTKELQHPVKRKDSAAASAAFAEAATIYQRGGTEDELGAVLREVANDLDEINVSRDVTDYHWQLLDLNKSKARFDAVRFTVPDNASSVDLMWSMILSSKIIDGGLIPRDGSSDYANRCVYFQTTNQRELDNQPLVARSTSGQDIKPGQEFIIWFALGNEQVTKGRVAVNLAPKELLDDTGWVVTPSDEKAYGDLPLVPRKHLLFHGSPLLDLSLSRDATRLATAGEDETVKIWDVATEKVVATCSGKIVEFSPDGRLLATDGLNENGASVMLWDALSGEKLHELSGGHFLGITALAFSPDGRRLASGGRDGIVTVWNTSTGEPGWAE